LSTIGRKLRNSIPIRKASFSTELFQTEWVPASRSIPRSQQKLMIVLHGRGDGLRAFRSLKTELKIPQFNYLLLNADRPYLNGYSWCPAEPRHAAGLKQVRSKLKQLIRELQAQGWAAQDIYWLGHSQGCLVACDLVMHHHEVFGGLIGVSGYMWFFRGWRDRLARSGARTTPWLITHGTRDRVIRLDEIREDIMQLLKGDIDVHYREFMKGHDFDHREEVPFIRSWLQSRVRPPRQHPRTSLRSRPRDTLSN
jgi:phospholipase/carboxylesterase